ncbi:hypothetical protein GA0074692_4807 [Micromonospora pallida]|uniref:Uncharacterized protein n=1 Tax=Micromonospora pallida TaxID=145854 RepID=A0A1C6T8Q6_9ACTN|nr:hypothetical protein [Micromonospora pallida]SCL37845.1 hypothetical protein GA0074692_4807 [Micromonospora pallida]
MALVRVTRTFQVGAAALAAATLVGMAANPAAAETDPGWVSGWLSDTTVGAAGAPGRTAALSLSSSGATNPRVVFDLSGLTGVATATFPDWCVTAGAGVTCPMPPTATPDEFGTLNGTVPVVLRGVPGAADGAAGTIGYTVLADGVDGETQQAAVSVHAGPDVVSLVNEYVDDVDTGDTLAMQVALTSAGNVAVSGLRLTIRFPVGLEPAAYRNCGYGAGGQLSTIVVCVIPGTFSPGLSYQVPGGFATTVGPAALGDKRIVQTVEPATTAGPPPEGVVLERRPADSALRLRQVGVPVDVLSADHQYPSGQYYLRDVPGAFDVVALGAAATGSVGDTVTVQVGIRNDGPGVPDGTISGGHAALFAFVPPAGTVVANQPTGCSPTGDGEGGEEPVTWYCTKPGGVFAAGETFLVGFDLRIDGPLDAAGEVRIPYGYPRTDDNPANDSAPVTIS